MEKKEVEELRHHDGEERVYFSLKLRKVTSKGGIQMRYLVCTSVALYLFNWTYRKPVTRICLDHVESILQGDGKLFVHAAGSHDVVYVGRLCPHGLWSCVNCTVRTYRPLPVDLANEAGLVWVRHIYISLHACT